MARTNLSSLSCITLLSIGTIISLTSHCTAQTIYKVTINTSFLISNPDAPYSLDIQLTDSSGTNDGNNIASISNFNFGTGGAVGTANITGNAIGNLSSGATLKDTVFFSELYQQFTPGATLSFQVSITENTDVGGLQDGLFFAILDKNLVEIPVSSNNGAILSFSLDSANPSYSAFSGIGAYASIAPPVVTLVAPVGNSVPEPGALALFSAVLFGAGFAVRSRSGKRCRTVR